MENSAQQVAYREFRASVIGESYLKDRHLYAGDEAYPFRKRRKTIEEFRRYLDYYAGTIIQNTPEAESLLRKALRIPQQIPLRVTKLMKFGQFLLGFLPDRFLASRAKMLISPVGSYEGRAVVYRLHARRTFFWEDYSETFDFAIMHLPANGMFSTEHRMRHVDIFWMRVFIKLGVVQKKEMDRLYENFLSHRSHGILVLALVELQIIKSVNDLTLLHKDKSQLRHAQEPSYNKIMAFRQVVTLLRNAGVAAPWIVRLIGLPLWMFNVQRLTENLNQLRLGGNEISVLVERMADQLMRAKPERWEFLMEALNLRSAHDMVRFETLIGSEKICSHAFASALLQHGADIDAMEACQKLILREAQGDDKTAPVRNLNTLRAKPHELSFYQLAEAEEYLFVHRDLDAYLSVLDSHGFAQADAVLAFQCCYRQIYDAASLDAWLHIAAKPAAGQSVNDIAEWLTKAVAVGYIDAFRYLMEAGELKTFSHLQQALKLAPLGLVLLRYIREERGITGLSSLISWYYHDAMGIREIRRWYRNDVVSRVLLDDAFKRKNFTLLKGNMACVETLLRQCEVDTLGRLPSNTNDAHRDEYRRQCQLVRESLEIRLAPKLKLILEMTGGILLLSLLIHIDETPEQLRIIIAELDLKLNGLLMGLGPDNPTLTQQEADMIALVYHTNADAIQALWPQVTGKVSDIVGNPSALTYPMIWQQTELEVSVEVDPRGLQAMRDALVFSAHFEAVFRKDMHIACRHLKAARLGDKAVDVWGLSQHLGVLLAISGCGASVSSWIYGEEDQKSGAGADVGLESHQMVESLVNLFSLELIDALNMQVAEFVGGLNDADADLLASRLDKAKDMETATPKERLSQAIERTRSLVCKLYLHWAVGQKKRFAQTKMSGVNSTMRAVISQSPAAFFAKQAAGLCSAGNTKMWQEARNLHLLIFPSEGKKLEGMALLNFETIRGVDHNKKTLVIRAVNPVKAVMASHDISSIIESFFDVAIRIAQDTGCVAVAFPAPSGQGFMSNHKAIEDYIEDNYIKCSKDSYFHKFNENLPENLRHVPIKLKETFYAYETGRGAVDALYIIWYADIARGIEVA